MNVEKKCNGDAGTNLNGVHKGEFSETLEQILNDEKSKPCKHPRGDSRRKKE